MNALPVPKPGPMTVGEFLDWPGDGTADRWHLVAGRPVAQAAPATAHSEIQGRLTVLLGIAFQDRPPCRPLTEVGLYKSKRHFNLRVADVVVTCEPPGGDGPVKPGVVIEILSPSNSADTLAALPFYATFDHIQEIVMLESEAISARVYRRGPGDWFDIPAETLGEGDMLVLRSIDVSLPLADIYRNVFT